MKITYLAPEKKIHSQGVNECYIDLDKSEASALQVWAIGVFLYKLYLGAFPTEQSDSYLPSDLPDNWFEEPQKNTLEHLIWRMLQKDPQKRIPLEDIPQAFGKWQIRT